MKSYLRNLISFLIGRNPYQEQLDAAMRRERSLQTLVENLRERIREKDELIYYIKKDYAQRIHDYDVEIDALRGRAASSK